jgi:hypothetical protein
LSRLLAYLGRFASIILGYFCASLAASAFLHLLLFSGLDWRGDELGAVVAGSVVLSIPFVALFVAYMAFLPALVPVLASEVLGLRGWLFHGLSGGAIALSVALLFARRETSSADAGLVLAVVAAGIVGGIVYWLVTGRSAGLALTSLVSGRER